MQGICFGGPSVVGVIGLVEGGMGTQGVEFMPGQVMADRQPQRGIGRIAALGMVIGAGGTVVSADPGPGRQGS